MDIIRKSCADAARQARRLAFIIDVFRAFSCAPLFYHFGAKRLILEADPEKALALKRQNPAFVLVGEVDEVPIEGAELGNSPSHIIQKGEALFKGKTVIHRTTAGVTGATAAYAKAEEVILGSFVMARAIARYIRETHAPRVTIVAMGDRARRKAPEDEACADYLEHLLTGKAYDPVGIFRDIVFQHTTRRFTHGAKDYLPPEDPIFCLQRDLFDFVLTLKRTGDRVEAFQADL